MQNINTIVFNSDLTVKSQTESPIQAFSSYQNIVRVAIPYGTDYIPFGIFHATNDEQNAADPAQFIVMIDSGTTTVDGETYKVYEQTVPSMVVASKRATRVEFVLSLWSKVTNFIGVQRYDETEQGYNDTTYIAAELLNDFPNADEDDYVRVFNTETDWEFDGTAWVDTDDVFESVLEDYRSDVIVFALRKGNFTGQPTHTPSNTEAIIDAINLKVSKTGDTMIGALQFPSANQTRIILADNNITMDLDASINATSFANGDYVSDAIKFSDLGTLFQESGIAVENPSGDDNWLEAYQDLIQAKFDKYITVANLNNLYYTKTQTDNLLNNKSNVGHTHTESDITDLDKYTQDELDNGVLDARYYTENETDNKFMDKATYVDGNDKIKLSKLPDAAKSQTFVVLSTDERPVGVLEGDKLYETDTGDSYIYDGTDWVILAEADWHYQDMALRTVQQILN